MRHALVAAAMFVGGPAHAYTAQNSLQVSPISSQDFAVEFRLGAKTTDYWCAAGDYVVRQGLGDRTRVYRLSPEPQKRGQGISFTLDPARSTGKTGISSFSAVKEDGMTAGVATAKYCHDFDIMIFPGFD